MGPAFGGVGMNQRIMARHATNVTGRKTQMSNSILDHGPAAMPENRIADSQSQQDSVSGPAKAHSATPPKRYSVEQEVAMTPEVNDVATDMLIFDAQKVYAAKAFLAARALTLYRLIKESGEVRLDATGYQDLKARGWTRDEVRFVLGHLLVAKKVTMDSEDGTTVFYPEVTLEPQA